MTAPPWSCTAGPALAAVLLAIVLVALPCSSPAQLTRLTDDPARDWDPYWSPDGSTLVFTSDRSGENLLYTMPATGGEPEQLTSGAIADYHPCWSPDGTTIAFCSHRSGNQDIWMVPSTGGTPVRLTDDPAMDAHPDWSPDGTKIAFTSDREGDDEIYILDLTQLSGIGETPMSWGAIKAQHLPEER